MREPAIGDVLWLPCVVTDVRPPRFMSVEAGSIGPGEGVPDSPALQRVMAALEDDPTLVPVACSRARWEDIIASLEMAQMAATIAAICAQLG